MRKQYVGKNISELKATIDSVGHRVDSIGRGYSEEIRHTSFSGLPRNMAAKDKGRAASDRMVSAPVNVDSLILSLDGPQQDALFTAARNLSARRSAELQFKAEDMGAEKKTIRRHEIELLKKYTLSVACLVFFFIGAPLGAIIRKGGLGTPLVISVLLFLVYYIFDNTGYKMARDGHWPVWFGMWLSSFVLIPLGAYVTIKAMNDSSVFDKDLYINFLNKLLGRRQARSVRAKEVIINDISIPDAIVRLETLKQRVSDFLRRYTRRQTFAAYWLRGMDMNEIAEIGNMTDEDVEYLMDCRDPFVVNKLTEFPVIAPLWVYAPARRKWLAWTMLILFLISLPVWLFGLDAQSKLKQDMKRVVKACDTELELLTQLGGTD